MQLAQVKQHLLDMLAAISSPKEIYIFCVCLIGINNKWAEHLQRTGDLQSFRCFRPGKIGMIKQVKLLRTTGLAYG